MRDYLQRAAIRAPNRIRVKKKTPPEGRVGKFMERATGLEPANTSLGSSYASWLVRLRISRLTSFL